MKLSIKLQKRLEEKYYELDRRFQEIREDWKKFEDEIIPEDEEFAQEIVRFVRDVINYIIRNFDTIDRKKYREFLAYYEYNFFYGPNGDDHNYLKFDEKWQGEPVNEFFWEIQDPSFRMTRKYLEKARKKYDDVLKQFTVQRRDSG